MTPSKDQVNLARNIIAGNNKLKRPLTSQEIRERMEKLVKIHKGQGHPMYESFKIVLLERSMMVEKR